MQCNRLHLSSCSTASSRARSSSILLRPSSAFQISSGQIRLHSVVVRAQDEKGDASVEGLFAKELRRRGLSLDEGDGGEDAKAASSSTTNLGVPAPQPTPRAASPSNPTPKNPFAGDVGGRSGSAQARSRSPPPMSYVLPDNAEMGGQREKSLALVSEGLEGLIPRATELIKLGGSFFLAFAPFVLAVALLFGGVYAVFGESFIHGGRENQGPPPYIDPMRLLSEQTVDGYIPFR